ncbi:MAG: 2-succinyl-6-hydroxy-2,4-cyclohexadiene-carboxylic acid synthase/2-oxoglutarate decarboxylase [Myxococcales bacterium]|nr:2-succinyl-6-hydroxy-2,4-cyclohexadiene-carboxylic acid synthase/2-oxoglutarate decarboxylase [Myxococcales bacterium]
MTAAVQTLWAELVVASLADAGVVTCVISPGSRSTPLALALAADPRFDLPTIIDERAAAFFALGVARATDKPAAMLCTSGSAAAHYLPAIVEASLAGIPLVAITADRPPELQQCGATQTIDQVKLYGGFVRGAFDLGAPVGSALAMRAVRRKVIAAVTLSRGPHPGPVHVDVPLRKPLEPAAPSTDEDRALARVVAELRGTPVLSQPPKLVADHAALDALAAAIAAESHGIIVAGAMPVQFAASRRAVLELAARAGYPVLAEAGSQVRFGSPSAAVVVDQFDLVLALAGAPAPRLIIRLGAEPVAAGWSAAQTMLAGATRYVLADHDWRDPDSSAAAVIIGNIADSLAYLAERVGRDIAADATRHEFAAAWHAADLRGGAAIDRALAAHPRSEGAVLRAAIAAMPKATLLQIGNSLPIRVIDLVSDQREHRVITQRGAAGIDGLVASAAGATRAGCPVLLVLGDVSFAHDLGGLLAARQASAPLAILVVDNGGGRIFAGLPIARAGHAEAFERHFITAPDLDPTAIASALGVRAVTAATPAAVATAIGGAISHGGVTVIHAPVTASGAHDVRRAALELISSSNPAHPRAASTGARYV